MSLTVYEVRQILDRISVRFPFGGRWQLEAYQVGTRIFIHGSVASEDAKTGGLWWLSTREYVIDPDSDEASVVRTVWAMVQTAYVHEASEFFKLDGVAVMGPHEYGNGEAKP